MKRRQKENTHSSFIYIQNKVSQKSISSTKTCDQSGHILEATGNKMAASVLLTKVKPKHLDNLLLTSPIKYIFLNVIYAIKRG